MAYRRRANYRSFSRRSRPNYLWVRNHDAFTTTITGAQYCALDLLAPVHYDQQLMRIPGPGTGQPALDLQNSVVTRVIGQVYVHMVDPSPPATTNFQIVWGVTVANWQQDAPGAIATMATAEPFDRLDPFHSANTTDWMGWGAITPLGKDQVALDSTSGAGSDASTISYTFDIKSRRRMTEIGQTLLFAAAPMAPGASLNWELGLTTSVLLRRKG